MLSYKRSTIRSLHTKGQCCYNTVFYVVSQRANYFGSITQASTVCLGPGSNGEDVFVPMYEMLPMVNPNDIVIDGK